MLNVVLGSKAVPTVCDSFATALELQKRSLYSQKEFVFQTSKVSASLAQVKCHLWPYFRALY